ncbi:MAG: hypothetical protein ABIO39_08160 [Caulobacteraceae bacterium]
MDVRLAEERVLLLPDYFDMESAQTRAAARRIDAFGTLAKMAGLLAKPKADDIELVYKERRLQPYWGMTCTAVCAYERTRRHALKLPPEVRQIAIAGQTWDVQAQAAAVQVLETCRQEIRKESMFDALTGQPSPDLPPTAKTAARRIAEDALAGLGEGAVVVPPRAKAPVVIRDMLATLGPKIEADRLIEETVSFEAIDLYYRPIYAFRYRRGAKEAVVEVDGVTGEVKLGGATFEAYLGKMLDPRFLIEVGAETVNLFIPGATLVKVLVNKGMDLRERR